MMHEEEAGLVDRAIRYAMTIVYLVSVALFLVSLGFANVLWEAIFAGGAFVTGGLLVVMEAERYLHRRREM